MSPLLVRRYRAERLLREEFDGLRTQVLGIVGARLRTRGVQLDGADLEACYAAAWQGLYATVLSGEEVANPAGWLVLVTFRRAIDEHRSRLHEDREELALDAPGDRHPQRDLAQEVDDRDRLRQLFEGLRSRLSARECEAASLCYLQGLSRAQAAVRMGISEARMRKLMEGDARKGPGVAGKVGALLETIRAGGWCEQQSSLMRGLAFGVLDPEGERYRLARLHQRECPACRAYVRSLRGLAAVLPPMALPSGLGIGALAGAGAGASSGAGSTSAGGVGSAAGVAGAAGVGGAAGVSGAAGGGWLLAGGSVGAKLAVGCVLALGFGAGCVALTHGGPHDSRAARRHLARAPANAHSSISAVAAAPAGGLAATGAGVGAAAGERAAGAVSRAARALGKAQREFGPEGPPVAERARASAAPMARPASTSTSPSRPRTAAHAASAGAVEREFGAG